MNIFKKSFFLKYLPLKPETILKIVLREGFCGQKSPEKKEFFFCIY